MLTRIVRPSPALESFLDSLRLPLSRPQRDHLLQFADSLLVCDGAKTLAALQRQFLDSTDPSNWADFLRISSWLAADVRTALRRHQVEWLVAEAQQRGLPKILYVNLDDSLGKKDKATSQIEPVNWFHDHNESTPRQPRYHKAFCYLECTAARRGSHRHGRPATLSAAQDRTATQSSSRCRAPAALPQQVPPGSRDLGIAQAAVAGGLDDLHPIRQLVRLGEAAQIHPSSGLACGLRPEEQPEVLWATPPSVRRHFTAQAVHARCA